MSSQTTPRLQDMGGRFLEWVFRRDGTAIGQDRCEGAESLGRGVAGGRRADERAGFRSGGPDAAGVEPHRRVRCQTEASEGHGEAAVLEIGTDRLPRHRGGRGRASGSAAERWVRRRRCGR